MLIRFEFGVIKWLHSDLTTQLFFSQTHLCNISGASWVITLRHLSLIPPGGNIPPPLIKCNMGVFIMGIDKVVELNREACQISLALLSALSYAPLPLSPDRRHCHFSHWQAQYASSAAVERAVDTCIMSAVNDTITAAETIHSRHE